MKAFAYAERWGHEEIVIVRDAPSGLHAVIALHDTTLGPAIGGTRMREYASEEDALLDALRLARAMTSKSAMAGLPYGGGKAVILGDPARQKTPRLLTAFARAVERLGGRFHTGTDMGLDGRDIAVMARVTRYASHTPPECKVESASLAALGVFASLEQAAQALGRPLCGLHVAIQGLGALGGNLATLLSGQGARLTVCDVVPARVDEVVRGLGAQAVAPESIFDVEADIFSPNAAGGILDGATIPRLRCRAVVGGANDQLADDAAGQALHARGILYGPDYVVNAGGLISVLLETGALDETAVIARVRAIGDTVADIWASSRRDDVPPARVADAIVEQRLAAARAAREET